MTGAAAEGIPRSASGATREIGRRRGLRPLVAVRPAMVGAVLPAMVAVRRRVVTLAVVTLLTLVVLTLVGCGRTHPDRRDWVIRSQLVFVSDDLRTPRAPLAATGFRLFFPYIMGDLYGSPTTGDFLQPALSPDYHFQIDLNRTHAALLASLEKTDFSVSYLHIDPPEARVARLAPQMFQADGIEQVGRLEWRDPDAQQELLLLYLDRPATITGHTTVAGRPLRYDIRAAAADYVWVGRHSNADEDVYTVVPKPARLLLAARPVANDRPPAASPARTDIPAR